MRRQGLTPILGLACALAMSCGGPAPVEDASQIPSEPEMAARIDAYLSHAIDELELPGVAAAAANADSTLYSGAIGVRNFDTRSPLRPENLFHMASVSKPFVATAIVQLVEQGAIDLDSPVTQYLPYFKLADGRYGEITIRQMLSHSSGMPDVEDYEWDNPQYDEGAAERFVRSLAQEEMIFAPGGGTRYSNMAFDTLGDVIAKVSGMSFEDYMKSRILDPLEMRRSTFLYPETDEGLRTTGHVWDLGPVVSDVYPYNRRHAPSSTLNSNVLEMTHWIQANLRKGEREGVRILKAESYDLLWTPQSRLSESASYGLSWLLTQHDGQRLIRHSGGDTGYASYMMILPEEGIGVVLASNYDQTPVADLAFGVLAIVRGRDPEPVRRSIAQDVYAMYQKEGLAAAEELLAPYRREEAGEQALNDRELNRLGYRLLARGHVDQAIDILRLNARLFPDVANVWDSLAEATAESGDAETAIELYRKALEVDPDFESAKRGLERLETDDR